MHKKTPNFDEIPPACQDAHRRILSLRGISGIGVPLMQRDNGVRLFAALNFNHGEGCTWEVITAPHGKNELMSGEEKTSVCRTQERRI